MKIIQTFWCDEAEITSPLEIKAGWASCEYHWMSWALSCHLLRRHYNRVELYTNEMGKRILIDLLKLPYTDVHVVFDNSFKIHSQLFSLAKIKTYGLQKEPFLHVDGDVFLWKPLPKSLLNSQLIASNLELNLFFNKEILDEVESNFSFIPEYLKGISSNNEIYASNAGILGGSDISFFNKYCRIAEQIITGNKSQIKLVKVHGLNWLIEQISFFYLAKQEEIPISYLVNEPVRHPLYQDYWQFADIPYVDIVHPVGGCKREQYVLDHLSKRVRLDFPHVYYKILKLCKAQGIQLRNRFYSYIDFSSIETNVINEHPSNRIEKPISSIEEVSKNSFEKKYYRTLITCNFYFSKSFGSYDELLELVRLEKTPPELKEVFRLEKIKSEQYDILVKDFKKGELYLEDFIAYKDAVNFFLRPGWTKAQVSLQKGVQLLELSHDWSLVNSALSRNQLSEFYKLNKTNCMASLRYNVLGVSISETYHDVMDSLVIKNLEESNSIKNLLLKLINYFDDDILETDKDFQKLTFDILKRLAFKNIVALSQIQT